MSKVYCAASTFQIFDLYIGNHVSLCPPHISCDGLYFIFEDIKENAMGYKAGPDLNSVLSLMPVATTSLNKIPAKICKKEELNEE